MPAYNLTVVDHRYKPQRKWCMPIYFYINNSIALKLRISNDKVLAPLYQLNPSNSSLPDSNASY